MTDAFPYPVARIGIIGGGQLGRMLVIEAHRLGCTCVVLDPVPGSPAGQVAGHQIVGDYHDPAKLRELAAACDVMTFELENIGADTLGELEAEGTTILPRPALLATVQDKLLQKQLLAERGIPTAAFVAADSPSRDAFEAFGYPLVQKARRGGYDGRGVAILKSADEYGQHLPVPSLLERFVKADKELAVLVARGKDGISRCFPCVEMCFRDGENILDMLLAPANISAETAQAAEKLAIRTVEALDGVGVFGVEMFLDPDGALSVNEVAPRTHNSGHYTIEACVTGQFEQHLRAILGLPLGATELLSPAVMINLLGEDGHQGQPVIEGLSEALSIDGVSVHLYGKSTTKPFRKMGHVTVLGASVEDAQQKARRVRDIIRITGRMEQ